ncbi:MAG: endonuclease MutS2, partial [Lachnospiraceae bacterium]|nr:endonuclease MutS2 [Lachnospiraceae bacterium]
MNKKVLKTLEYNKIIDMLTDEADSPLGKSTAAALLPIDEREQIRAWQTETSHALMRIFKHGTFGFHGLRDIRSSLVPLEKGATLGISELLNISSLLDVAAKAIAFDKKDEELNDSLSGRFHSLVSLPDINREIKRCILSPEEISDDASPELKRIRRSIKSAGEQIHGQMTKTLTSSSAMLQENIITVRNGRYCLPVKAEYKSSFPGMIHDQSSSGSTYFIEPMAVVKLNNQLAELAVKEQEEIQKILAALSNLAAPECEVLARNVILLAELDFIFAKAKLSKKMQGSEPIFDDNYIEIKKGRHPLIPKEKVVPIDVSLGKDYSL